MIQMKKTFFLCLTRAYNFYNKHLPKIYGINSIYSSCYHWFNPNTTILVNFPDNKLYVNTRETGLVPLILNGTYEGYETELFKNLVHEGTILIDIGANIGYYTLIGANIIKKGSVYSFEPVPDNYDLLLKNIEINNLNNVTAVQKAVSNKIGKVKIFLDEFSFGTHSLAQNNVPDKINFTEVNTTTLDSFFDDKFSELDKILVKMDTQGAEGLIVKGADSLLKKESIKIMMEFWPMGLKNMGTEPEQLLEKLEEYGFKINLINGQKKCLEHLNNDEIIRTCQISQSGYSNFVNLLLEK